MEVCYPLPPYLYDRFKADFDYCTKKGLKLALRMFRGKSAGKVCPKSYSEEELQEIFLKYSPEYNSGRVHRGSLYGHKCNAGRNLVRVRCNGDVVSCLHDYTLLGNIFTGFELKEETIVCRVPYCGAWSLEMLFNDPEQRAQIEEPPPLTLFDRQKLKFAHFGGWWQGDWISPAD